MKSVLALLAVAGAALISSAAAQEAENSLGSVYARVGGGVSFVSDWDQDLTFNPNIGFIVTPPSSQTVDNGSGIVGAFALGFDYADGIRTELEYRYASSSIESVTPSGAFNPDPDIDPNAPRFPDQNLNGHFLMTNFYFDFTNSSPLTPFIGGGVGGAFIQSEFDQRDAALAYQGRAGVSYELAGGFLADVEYIYLRTNELSFGTDIEDFGPSGPTLPNISGDRYISSSVMMSLRKHF